MKSAVGNDESAWADEKGIVADGGNTPALLVDDTGRVVDRPVGEAVLPITDNSQYAATAADETRMRLIITYLLAHDVRVRYVPGWERRGRAVGSFHPVGGLIHHDASTSGEYGATTYCATLSPIAPLCQIMIARCSDGVPTVVVIATGRCNHSGTGGPWHGIAENTGNGLLYGVEAANNGLGETWTQAALRAYHVTMAAVATVTGRNDTYMLGLHAEWAEGRKGDANFLSVANPSQNQLVAFADVFRGKVRDVIRGDDDEEGDLDAAQAKQLAEVHAFTQALKVVELTPADREEFGWPAGTQTTVEQLLRIAAVHAHTAGSSAQVAANVATLNNRVVNELLDRDPVDVDVGALAAALAGPLAAAIATAVLDEVARRLTQKRTS